MIENKNEVAKENFRPPLSAIKPAAIEPMIALNIVSIGLTVQHGITYEATGPPLKAPCQLAGCLSIGLKKTRQVGTKDKC
jgi:hypothetical protein